MRTRKAYFSPHNHAWQLLTHSYGKLLHGYKEPPEQIDSEYIVYGLLCTAGCAVAREDRGPHSMRSLHRLEPGGYQLYLLHREHNIAEKITAEI